MSNPTQPKPRCSRCNGKGFIREKNPMETWETPCPKCTKPKSPKAEILDSYMKARRDEIAKRAAWMGGTARYGAEYKAWSAAFDKADRLYEMLQEEIERESE